MSIGDYITFDDINVYSVGSDILKNNNNKSFNLVRGKIYEIIFNSMNYSSNIFAIFEVANYDTNTAIQNNYNDINFGADSKTTTFMVDLTTYTTNINIGIRVKYTNATSTNKLILGVNVDNSSYSNCITPNITIKNLTGSTLQVSNTLDTNMLSLIKTTATGQLTLSKGQYVTFNVLPRLKLGNDISQNSNNQYFNLNYGKVYEIEFFSSMNNLSTDYAVFNLYNTNTNTIIGETTYANYGHSSGYYNFILDLNC